MTRWRTWLAAPVVLAALLAACTSGTPAAGGDPAGGAASPTPATPDEDVVDLTVYLRQGDGEDAHLVGVTRAVPVDSDLQRRALELLIAGPEPDEEDLEAPLPTTTEVRELRVEDHVAHADLSAEVISDAERVGATPGNEALALAAVADTLTEFPEIDRVRLSVEGRHEGEIDGVADVRAFWGGWGLPDVLVRDDSLVEPEGEGDRLPELEAFAAGPQTAGSRKADPVDVRGVRTRDRTSYLRVVVELADASDEDAAAAVPPARAWSTGDDIVLELREVAGYDEDKIQLDPVDPAFADVDAEVEEGRLRVTVTPDQDREFALTTLTRPVRVILDVRK